MKKITCGLLLFSFLLMGCSNSSPFLRRPIDTNLSLWITEEVDEDSLSSMTYLPGGFGMDIYLDSSYETIDNGDGTYRAPDVHVIYQISAYPDYSDGGSYVTYIGITDPTINVYGLSLSSSQEDIGFRMTLLGFTHQCQECSGIQEYWSKNNCAFTFNEYSITIGASISNRDHLVF